MSTLSRQKATFSNDTNPKNESNPYQFLDQEGADKLSNWGERLDSWMLEVQLRCANESRTAGLGGKITPLARLHTAPLGDRPRADGGDRAADMPFDAQAEASLSGAGAKWGSRIASIVK